MARQRAYKESISDLPRFPGFCERNSRVATRRRTSLESLEPISDDYETIQNRFSSIFCNYPLYMADQNTAVEQVCTLGAIQGGKTGPAQRGGERQVQGDEGKVQGTVEQDGEPDKTNLTPTRGVEAEDDLAQFDIT